MDGAKDALLVFTNLPDHDAAVSLAREHGDERLYLVNGEASVWAAQFRGVPAFTVLGESRQIDTSAIAAELSGFVVAVVYDADEAGRREAPERVSELRAAGVDACALDITQAGSYVLYLETAECTAEPVEMRRVGEPSATPGPVDDQRFESYSYDELCGVPVGSYDLRTAGLWTALPTASNGGNAVLYGSDDPPVYVDWDGSWLYFALMAVGAVVLTYGVVQRRREFGIRLALGARASQVTGVVVRDALALTAIALIVGLTAALGLTRALSGLLYEVSPRDPITLGAVALVVAAVAVAAAWVPARRATRIDPAMTIRDA